MEKQERIVCAAVNIVTAKEDNFIIEEVFCGVDYQAIENTNIFKTYCNTLNVISNTKGFITNRNRFVDPKEAMSIAMKAKQINFLNVLSKEYDLEVIKNRGVSEKASVLFKALKHQESIYSGGELKPEDIY